MISVFTNAIFFYKQVLNKVIDTKNVHLCTKYYTEVENVTTCIEYS